MMVYYGLHLEKYFRYQKKLNIFFQINWKK